MYETENIAAVGDGNVAVVCSVATCGEIATIMIEHRARAEQPRCAEHWQQAHGSAPQSLNVVRTLPATELLRHQLRERGGGGHGAHRRIPLPCCESHLDDLSWVVPDEVDRRSGS